MKNNTVVYPGTFDPITIGHIDLVKRAIGLFGSVVIGIADNEEKSPLLSLDERVEIAKVCFQNNPKVEVMPFSGMVVDFVKSIGCSRIVRGLRTYSDFEYEFQMAITNRRLSSESIETAFIMSNQDMAHISSRLIREIAKHGGDLSSFVSPEVEKLLRAKYPEHSSTEA